MVTGVDLVKSQIRIAVGQRLDEILTWPLGKTIELRGHAIECRINAEHPETFVPSPGRITGLNLPGGAGIRVDTAAYQDGVIPPYYDSLVAKLIAHGSNRDEAIARMKRALHMFVIEASAPRSRCMHGFSNAPTSSPETSIRASWRGRASCPTRDSGISSHARRWHWVLSRGRRLRCCLLHSRLDRRTFFRRLCCRGFYGHLFNGGLLPDGCGFLCRSASLLRRRSLLSRSPPRRRTAFSFRFGGILHRPGGCLHGLPRPSDSSLRILKRFLCVGLTCRISRRHIRH